MAGTGRGSTGGVNRVRARLGVTALIFLTSLCFGAVYAWEEGPQGREAAMDLEGDERSGVEIYRLCADCHLGEGWGTPDGSYPVIAGQHPNVLIKQLTDIREGNRDNPAMYPFAQEEEIGGVQAVADVTAYIASLPLNPEPGVGPGRDLDRGKALYADLCASCHGSEGEGSNENFVPRIQGQHFAYLERQLRWIREGRRRNSNPAMTAIVNQMSEADLAVVSDFVSRIGPQPELLGPPDWINPDFSTGF